MLSRLAQISRSSLFAESRADPARGRHRCDKHVLASYFVARSKSRKNLRARRPVPERPNALLQSGSEIAGALQRSWACDRRGSTASFGKSFGRSVSGAKFDIQRTVTDRKS